MANTIRVRFQKPTINGFRLTLTSGVPVTTSDVTGTTIYCTPFKGNQIALYDGARWNVRTSAEFSLALGTLTSGKPYDVFCYDNVGVPTLEFLSWTNDTTRATALTLQDGVYVKSGATTRRYIGTFYTTSTTQTKDGAANRYLFNLYNQVKKTLYVTDTGSWIYNSTTIRQANANTANQVNIMNGLDINAVQLTVSGLVASTSADSFIGIGLDSTTTHVSIGGFSNFANATVSRISHYNGFIGVGKHYLSWLEASNAGVGNPTWYGVYNYGVDTNYGLTGSWLC